MNYRHLPIGLYLLTLLGCSAIGAEQPPVEPRQKSVTVYPVVITPSTNIGVEFPRRIGEVLGLYLERAGMDEIEISNTSFSPPETDDVSELAAAFGVFVGHGSLTTEYAVFGQILGTPKTGPKEIRTVVVDKAGRVIFADRAGAAEFSRSKTRPKDPMTCTLFLANRLGEVWQLADPLQGNAPAGKMAELLRMRSGAPTDEEIAEVKQRYNALKGKFVTSQVTVYPIHLWPGSDKPGASKLATMLTEQGICQAEASDTDPKLVVKGDPNEQKVLWDTARSFRDFLRKNPPTTPYALLADYGLGAASDGMRSASHVHVIVCERDGDWVLVDYQNSHHEEFQRFAPKTADDCNRLAAVRLKNLLSK
jgi:hypothetical protein